MIDLPGGPSLEGLRRAVIPLDAPPDGAAWNQAEVADLLPAAAPIPAAVLVGLVARDAGWRVLLTRRTHTLRRHAGQVAFPGGRIDATDADARSAALRETEEEIGVAAAQVMPLGWLDPLATITGFRVLPLLATIAPDYVPRPDPREVAAVFEVPLAQLMAAEKLRRRRVDWRGRPREVLEFVDMDDGGQRIWGATASILLNLRQRLEAR